MTTDAARTPIPGVSRVTTIRPPVTAPTVLHQTDGTLALSFDDECRDRHPGDDPESYAVELDGPPPAHPELRQFTGRFCAAVIEVLAGDRGPAQLLHVTAPEVYEDLVRRGQTLALVAGPDQRLHRPRPRIRSVHIAAPAPGVAEFSIHVRHGHRSRAVAGRLVWRRDTWLCVALQFG